jgi:hypothetical protein
MLAAAHAALAQRLRIDVNHDLMAIAAGQHFSAMGEEAFGDSRQRICSPHSKRRSLTRRRTLLSGRGCRLSG